MYKNVQRDYWENDILFSRTDDFSRIIFILIRPCWGQTETQIVLEIDQFIIISVFPWVSVQLQHRPCNIVLSAVCHIAVFVSISKQNEKRLTANGVVFKGGFSGFNLYVLCVISGAYKLKSSLLLHHKRNRRTHTRAETW